MLRPPRAPAWGGLLVAQLATWSPISATGRGGGRDELPELVRELVEVTAPAQAPAPAPALQHPGQASDQAPPT